MVSPKGRELTKSVLHSGKVLQQLLSCVCRSSQRIPSALSRNSESNVEQLSQSHSWLRDSICVLERIRPVWQERECQIGYRENRLVDDWNVILEIEKNILRVIDFISYFLRPLSPQVLLSILNPFGHSWNMLREEEEDESPVKVTRSQTLHLGPIDDF